MSLKTKKGKLQWRNKRANKGRKGAKSLARPKFARSHK